MLKKLITPVLALSVIAGTTVSTASDAEARRGGRIAAGVAAGVIGLGLLGAYAHSRPYYYRSSCYRVPGECYWKRGSCYVNRYGEEVCRRGYQVCEPSRTVCD